MERRIGERIGNISAAHVLPHSHILGVLKTELHGLARATDADRAALVVQGMGMMLHEARLDHSCGDRIPEQAFRFFPKSSEQPHSSLMRSSSSKSHHAQESNPSLSKEDAVVVRVPIPYAGAEIGELRLELQGRRHHDTNVQTICVDVARRVALLAQRHHVHAWAAGNFGMNTLFVGRSRALLDLEGFVELASRNPHPVLITGEFGTEKTLTAMALHALSADPSSPFIEIHCASHHLEDSVSGLSESIEAASGGTVFFNAIDELPPRMLQKLPELLASHFGQWLPRSKEQRPLRIVASTTSNLGALVQSGCFPKKLLAELDFLSVELPPLRERLDDIPAIVGYLLEKNGFLPQEKCSAELIATCRVYGWPENLFELERTIVRLAAMTGRSPITAADIDKYTPWIRKEPNAHQTAGLPSIPVSVTTPLTGASFVQFSSDQWVQTVVLKDLSRLRILHPNLQKALTYLSENYSESISLGQLARHACISPSHLAYLFKSAIGIPFKPFLGRVRIEKAKQRLIERVPVRITEVALDVGFMDLSHFEKLFKRIVGVNAREYRRRSLHT